MALSGRLGKKTDQERRGEITPRPGVGKERDILGADERLESRSPTERGETLRSQATSEGTELFARL